MDDTFVDRTIKAAIVVQCLFAVYVLVTVIRALTGSL